MWRNCLDTVAGNSRTVDGTTMYPYGYADKGVAQNDESCIKNDDLCIKNDELRIENAYGYSDKGPGIAGGCGNIGTTPDWVDFKLTPLLHKQTFAAT